MSVSSLPEKIDSEYSAHILQEMLENDNLREIELVAELDDKRQFLNFISIFHS